MRREATGDPTLERIQTNIEQALAQLAALSLSNFTIVKATVTSEGTTISHRLNRTPTARFVVGQDQFSDFKDGISPTPSKTFVLISSAPSVNATILFF